MRKNISTKQTVLTFSMSSHYPCKKTLLVYTLLISNLPPRPFLFYNIQIYTTFESRLVLIQPFNFKKKNNINLKKQNSTTQQLNMQNYQKQKKDLNSNFTRILLVILLKKTKIKQHKKKKKRRKFPTHPVFHLPFSL